MLRKLYGFLRADIPYMYNNRHAALHLVNDRIHHQIPLLHGHGKALAGAACKIETVSAMLQHEFHHASGTLSIHVLFPVKERHHCRDDPLDLIHLKSAHFSLLFDYICVLKSFPPPAFACTRWQHTICSRPSLVMITGCGTSVLHLSMHSGHRG